MFKPVYRNRFEKELRKLEKRGKDMEKLKVVLSYLIEGRALDPKFRNHKLHGEFVGLWECHIEPDWLLIYEKTDNEIILTRTGSHSDLF